MGADKARIDLHGKPLLAWAVNAVAPYVEQVIVAASRPDAVPLDAFDAPVDITTDETAHQGPLSGMATALKAARQQWVLVLAADMPWVSQEVVTALWQQRKGYDVVVPIEKNGPEPLLALYRRDTMLAAAEKTLATGRRRIIAAFPALNVREVPLGELRKVDPHLISFFDINTQADLQAARRFEQTHNTASGASSDTASNMVPDATPEAQEI